ncbi:MAG: thioredoxin domain-containing protein [Gammaproteobacteria bacterium]|jgi:hypothetical protein
MHFWNTMSSFCVSTPLRLLVVAVVSVTVLTQAYAGETTSSPCSQPLTDHQVISVFKRSALNQLALEFGDAGLFVYELEHTPVDDTLVRVEAYAKYPKPGQKDLATMRIKGWVSRCSGTTIVRGNTWLADGTLQVTRYDAENLAGKGLRWGDPAAPLRFIVYLDSRCPHCHRLISYAKKLVKNGKAYLDLRQVAYLEDVQGAVSDTHFWQTSLVNGGGSTVSDEDYLELLGGFADDELVKEDSPAYDMAVQLIETNTATAKNKLHIITVPGVLIEETDHQGRYRRMGYWEINRIFQ